MPDDFSQRSKELSGKLMRVQPQITCTWLQTAHSILGLVTEVQDSHYIEEFYECILLLFLNTLKILIMIPLICVLFSSFTSIIIVESIIYLHKTKQKLGPCIGQKLLLDFMCALCCSSFDLGGYQTIFNDRVYTWVVLQNQQITRKAAIRRGRSRINERE